MEEAQNTPLVVAIVGPCASGKSTLEEALSSAGYKAHHVAQEHSYIQAMWQRFTQPDVLIYLDASYEDIMARRPKFNFKPKDLVEQQRRLAHAREHCDLYFETGKMTTAEIQEKTFAFLKNL
jgi:cytidylate kinase